MSKTKKTAIITYEMQEGKDLLSSFCKNDDEFKKHIIEALESGKEIGLITQTLVSGLEKEILDGSDLMCLAAMGLKGIMDEIAKKQIFGSIFGRIMKDVEKMMGTDDCASCDKRDECKKENNNDEPDSEGCKDR
jgi:hypothetical protein